MECHNPSDAESKQITPNSAVQPVPLPPQLQLFFADCPPVPQIEVAFNNGNWWSIPEEINTLLFEQYAAGKDAVYTWDWGETRLGSWKPDDEETSINRYMVDLVAMEQRNIDNDRRRSVRLVWVRPQDKTPLWTGQKPG